MIDDVIYVKLAGNAVLECIVFYYREMDIEEIDGCSFYAVILYF